nr:PqqD family protein [Microbacterium thalassium]
MLADAGAVIWDWLASPSTVTQLAARATEESGVLDPQVAADVEAFVADLVDCLFVEELPADFGAESETVPASPASASDVRPVARAAEESADGEPA